jgi:hypothetical protein
MNASGSSTNTSTRTVRVPAVAGVSHPLFSGSPRKIGAPAIDRPITLPKFHSSVAPSARAYHRAASPASGTASITEMTGSIDAVCHCSAAARSLPNSTARSATWK